MNKTNDELNSKQKYTIMEIGRKFSTRLFFSLKNPNKHLMNNKTMYVKTQNQIGNKSTEKEILAGMPLEESDILITVTKAITTLELNYYNHYNSSFEEWLDIVIETLKNNKEIIIKLNKNN